MSGSGGTTQTPVSTTTQTKDPWGPAQPYLQGAMNSASSLYNNTPYQQFPGATQAPEDPWLTAGLNAAGSKAWNDAVNGAGVPGVREAQTLGTGLIQNYGLSPELQALYNQQKGNENPYLQDVINKQMNQANAAMSGAGRYASGAHSAAIAQAIAPTLAQDYTRRQAMMNDILSGGLQRAGQWSQAMPGLYEASYMPMRELQNLGQYRTDRAQALINDQMKNWAAQTAYPWESLARYNAIVGGAGGLGQTQLTQASTPINQPSSLQRALGGGLAGAGIGSMFGPVGAGVGAVGGGLLGLL